MLCKIKLPQGFNYVACFLTLECQLKCPYCINHHGNDLYHRKRMSGVQWIEAINRLDLPADIPVTLQGGEPTLHQDFYDIINGIKPETNIDLLTNLQIEFFDFCRLIEPSRLKRKSPYASIRVSWHIGQNDTKDTLENVKKLQDFGYSIGIWAVTHPDYTERIAEAHVAAKEMGIDFRLKEFLGPHKSKNYGTLKYPDATNGKIKSCECKTSELLIDPAGYVFRCHSDLYGNRYPIGHIFDDDLKLGEWRPCGVYGLCNSCDVKIKTNRLQQGGYTAVEIKNII